MTHDEEDSMSELYQILSHSGAERNLRAQTRRHLGQIFHGLAKQ